MNTPGIYAKERAASCYAQAAAFRAGAAEHREMLAKRGPQRPWGPPGLKYEPQKLDTARAMEVLALRYEQAARATLCLDQETTP